MRYGLRPSLRRMALVTHSCIVQQPTQIAQARASRALADQRRKQLDRNTVKKGNRIGAHPKAFPLSFDRVCVDSYLRTESFCVIWVRPRQRGACAICVGCWTIR